MLTPDGSRVKARALLDPASSSSFVSEHLVQGLGIPRSHSSITVSGVAGLCSSTPFKSVVNVSISPTHSPTRQLSLSAVVVPRVTSDLPLSPVKMKDSWTHLDGLHLADPSFHTPGRIDLLLGVDVYVDSKEEHLSMEDQGVMNQFKESYRIDPDGRFIVPLAKRPNVKPLGESRSQALRKFMTLERTLNKKKQFGQLDKVVTEYFSLGHAELVPSEDLHKPPKDVFYLPIHAVVKASSTTTKLRAVFDASAKSSTGVSLNDHLLVGPTVHAPLVDVLLRFRQHRVAIITDVSKMYRAIRLTDQDRDLHRFVWRSDCSDVVQDYRMTRLTFGVSASSFVANMCVRQNALNHAHEFPLAAKAVNESFYVDDGLTGTDDEQTPKRDG